MTDAKRELERILRNNLLGIKPTMLVYEDDLPGILKRTIEAILAKLPELVEIDLDKMTNVLWSELPGGLQYAVRLSKIVVKKKLIRVKEGK